MHTYEHNAHKRACTFLYLSKEFNRAKFGDDDEMKVALKDFCTSGVICACMQAQFS